MSKMNWLGLMLASALVTGPAYAEETAQEDDDLTMEVIEDGTTPEHITSRIQLPDAASDVARENAAKGLATANAAREDGRAFGQGMAELRGEQGREIGAAAREAAGEIAGDARQSATDAATEARQNAADVAADARENRGRGNGRP
jgi:hypothetical protein